MVWDMRLRLGSTALSVIQEESTRGAGAALRMIDITTGMTGVFLTVRKTALCQERTSSKIAPLRLELPAPQARLPALVVPVRRPSKIVAKFKTNARDLDKQRPLKLQEALKKVTLGIRKDRMAAARSRSGS